MPKRASNRPGQTSLFMEETTDDVARKTFRTADEKAYAREKKRKRVKVEPQPIPPNGPCCHRCRSYVHALGDDEFGKCMRLGVALVRTARIEKGQVIDVREDESILTEALRCKPWAGQGCSAFVSVEGHEVAA